LLTASIFDDDPVIFIEQSSLVSRSVRMPAPEPGTRFPLGRANVSHEGSDVSVIGYGAQIAAAREVARRLADEGISVEVVDLRTIAPFDIDTILTSVAKTKRAVVVHEARTLFGPSAEISAQIRLAFSGCPVLARSRYQPLTLVRGTPRAAMSAQLITGRPLMAGMRTTSSLRRTRRRGRSRPPAPAPAPGKADPGILAAQQPHH
jgi:Transketolase, C-terminal domain